MFTTSPIFPDFQSDKVNIKKKISKNLNFLCFTPLSAISWRPVLVMEEAGVFKENHRPWASNW